jgi:hypothetical protein
MATHIALADSRHHTSSYRFWPDSDIGSHVIRPHLVDIPTIIEACDIQTSYRTEPQSTSDWR